MNDGQKMKKHIDFCIKCKHCNKVINSCGCYERTDIEYIFCSSCANHKKGWRDSLNRRIS